jgi:hypothetical protein
MQGNAIETSKGQAPCLPFVDFGERFKALVNQGGE